MGCSGCVSVRKWLLIFLLLSNVLVFFGYSMLSPHVQKTTSAPDGGVALRLVSELPDALLVKREVDSSLSVSAVNKVQQCWYYGALQNRQEADALVVFFQEQWVASDLQADVPVRGTGSVTLVTEADQEMISRLNAVIKTRYPHINIEKKLCKGVASP